jgi:hypothetical protein
MRILKDISKAPASMETTMGTNNTIITKQQTGVGRGFL